MDLLPAEYRQALRELTDTTDNPFYCRQRRRDERRSEPFRTLWSAALSLAGGFVVILLIVWGLMMLVSRSASWSPGALGAEMLFSCTATVHALLVSSAARNRITGLLARHARAGPLQQPPLPL